MIGAQRKIICFNFGILLLSVICCRNLYAQGAPVIGDAQVDTGSAVTGEYGSIAVVPINVNLSGITAVNASGATVPAVLGSYRIAISYDNTLIKARNTGGFVAGGTAAEFSLPAQAHILTSGTSDTLIIMQSQLSNISPVDSVNVAQVEFELLSSIPTIAPLAITVLDLRTPVIITGDMQQAIIGGVEIANQITNSAINILAGTDTDGDGMPDAWEAMHGFDPDNINDGVLDWDNDGLSNADEYTNSTDPKNPDSDNDLVPDGAEVTAGNNPNDDADFPLWITSVPITEALELRLYQDTVIANYIGATFSLDMAPAGMIINPSTGVISWTPALGQTGDFGISVRVNMNADTAIQGYVLNVLDMGDVNADGAVNVADYLLVQRHVLGVSMLDSQQAERADLYPAGGDSQVTVSDLILLMRKVMEM